METLVQECQQAKDRGQTPDELLQLMHQRGLTITEAIKAFMKIYTVPLGEAKDKVSASPYWRDIVHASGPLHDQLAEVARDLAGSPGRIQGPRETPAEVDKRRPKRRKTK